MAEISNLAGRLGRLLIASGWEVDSRRYTINAVEPAFEPISRTWMAGTHRGLSDAEIYAVNPSRVIVEDFTPDDEVHRLSNVLTALGEGGSVSRFTRFFDDFWGANEAVDAALKDAESTDADDLFGVPTGAANQRHVKATLRLGAIEIPDSRAMESGLPQTGTCMAVLADAGLGKSEFLRWHEWRYSSLYRNARSAQKPMDLPPVALRVPLRDFKSLSLDYVAHILSQPAEVGRLPLPRISSGAVLRELVIQGRLILFLDGLDEVAAESSTIDLGISEWRRVVREGGHFVLTSRAGHESSRGSIKRRFESDEIADLQPLGTPTAHELLMKRGSDSARAHRVIDALSGPAAGIPLFLLLANHVDLDVQPDPEASESRTLVLLKLLRLFCERDEGRLGVKADDQIDVLTQIAEWTMYEGPLMQDQLLKNLGIDDADPLARIVRNPHALLSNNDGLIEFKFREFGALFAALAIAQAWQNSGFNSISGILQTQKLDELVVEYLARLLHPAAISGAWVSSEPEGALILRRNLLAVALARVSDVAHAESSNIRAAELAKMLGNRSLIGLSVSGLYIERFDFTEWQMRKIHGHGGTVSYCVNLWRTDHDDTVQSLTLDGCNFDRPAENDADLSIGIDRLRLLVKPIRRKKVGPVITIMRREEARDAPGWELLVHAKLAQPSGKAATARWTLNSDGVRVLTAFNVADMSSGDALKRLIDTDQEVRALVERMSKR